MYSINENCIKFSRLAAQIASNPENTDDQTVGIDDQTKESQ